MMSQATCKFCALTDDTIQVMCESRCLICSRCQQVPILKKLLIEHTMAIDVSSTATQPARTYLKGFCPVCESSMSATMLSVISTYKELYKAAEDNSVGRPNLGMELEETSSLIPAFLKRYKATYEAEEKKGKQAAVPADQQRFMACNADIYDLASALIINRTPTNPNAVMEFIVDCYTAMWQNILRNARDSILTTTFRLFNRKRFSQRTNDMRTRAILDYIAATTGSETADFLLFGRLIGLQPKQSAQPRPAWGVIATCVIAAGFCDRCLKSGQICDLMGNPNVAEFRQKVSKMAGPADAKNYPAKSISLRKAIKIVELLSKVKQPYWVMSPIIPQCVEYASKLPWDAPSIAKLLNILIFVSLFEDSKNVSSANVSPVHSRGAGTRNSVSLPSITQSHSGAVGNRPTAVSFSLSPDQSTASLAATAAAFSAAGGSAGGGGTPGGGNRRRASTADASEQLQFGSTKIIMLRNLEALVGKLWRSSMNKNLSMPQAGKEGKMFFISSIDKHRYSSYINMDFESAFALADPSHTIQLSELAYVCITCWDAEYSTIKAMLSRGQTTFGRRPAILGFYDTTKAKMNGVERLCLIRLLHWYSTEHAFLGIDWDDVETNAKDRLFPFAIPPSLLQKSHNELNYLADVVVQDLKEQKLKDELEDAAVAEAGSIAAAHRKVEAVREEVATAKRREEEMSTLEQIEQYNREQYLASHTLGYVDSFLLHNQDALELEMESVKPSMSRISSYDDLGMVSREASRPGTASTNTLRRSATEGSGQVFLTDPTQECLELTMDLDRARSSAGLPTTAELAGSSTGAFSAFAAQTATAESIDAQLEASKPGAHGSRTAGGLARPLSPSRTHTLGTERKQARSPESSTYSPAGSAKLTAAKKASETSRPTSPEQPALTEGNYISRRALTPLELEVQKMVIRDPTKVITGKGVTGNALKLKRANEVSNPFGGTSSAAGSVIHEEGSVVSQASTQVSASGAAGVKLRNALGMHDEEQVDANKQYIEMREANRKTRLLAAQSRIHDRIAAKEQQELEENTASALEDGMINPMKIFAPRQSVIKPQLTRVNSQKRKVNVRALPVLDFNQYVGEYGQVTIEMATHLSAESAVKVFSFKNKPVSLPTFEEIVAHYFKPWHFDHLVRIDLVGINIGPFGARMLSERFAAAQVNLVHLNLTGCQIGGQGLRLLLQSLLQSDAAESLMRLDLQNNNISLASESFAFIGQFTNLRVLDMSRNCFTLDTPSQQKIFRDGLSPLSSLQTLSVAYNKIMDRGCKLVCEITKEHFPELQILDLAGCFLSKISLPVFETLLEHIATESDVKETVRRPSIDEPLYFAPEVVVELEATANPELREIMLQDNMFSPSQYGDYCAEHHATILLKSKCKLSIHNSKYIGVDFPLGYSLQDYDIAEYVR